ncbi:MAG: hypothetical protein IMW91_01435 [Firmicutes bacterium]|nr:hypothetical protein [Bacillota bacterium]
MSAVTAEAQEEQERGGPWWHQVFTPILLAFFLLIPVLDSNYPDSQAFVGRDPAGQVIFTGITHDSKLAQAGIQIGDRLLEVNGKPAEAVIRPGDTTIPRVEQFTVQTSHGIVHITYPIGAFSNRPSLVFWLEYALGISLFAAGWFVLAQRKWWPPAHRLYLFCVSAGLALAVAHPSSIGIYGFFVLERIALAAATAALPFFFHNLLGYAAKRWEQGGILAWPLLLAIVALLDQAGFTQLHLLNMGALLISLAWVGCWSLEAIVPHWRTTTPLVRAQLRVMLFGALVGITPIVLTVGLQTLLLNIQPLAGPPSEILLNPLWTLFILFIPLSIGYVFARDEVIDIRPLFRRSLVYGFFGLLLLGAYAVALFLIFRSGTVLTANVVTAAILINLALLLAFMALRERLQGWLEKAVFRDWYDYRQALQALSAAIAKPHTIGELTRLVSEEVMQVMHLEGSCLVLDQRESLPYVAAAAGSYAQNEKLRQQVEAAAWWWRSLTEPEYLPPGAPGSVLVPFCRDGVTIGALFLDRRTTRTRLSGQDLAWLQTIANQAVTAFENARLIAQLEQRVDDLLGESWRNRRDSEQLAAMNKLRVSLQEQERRRLAADLHDELLQNHLAAVRLMEEVCGQLADPRLRGQLDKAIELSKDTAFELRETAAQLYPTVLEHLGVEAALQWLAEETMRREDFTVHFTSSGPRRGERIHPEIELTLYRLAQEILSNVARHAAATDVEMHLQVEEDHVLLDAWDNGVGFQPLSDHELIVSGHTGLVNMKDRCRWMGGTLTLHSVPGEGTRIHVTLPISRSVSDFGLSQQRQETRRGQHHGVVTPFRR